MEHLLHKTLQTIHPLISQVNYQQDGLLGGRLGGILYQYYYSKVYQNPEAAELADTWVRQTFAAVNSEENTLIGSSFSTGGAGFAWVISHLTEAGWLDFDLDELADMDTYLLQSGLEMLANHNTDFLHQAGGILHYFSSRSLTPFTQQAIEQLVRAMYAIAVIDEHGLRLPPDASYDDKKLDYNLSLSHGLSAWLNILMANYEQGILQDLIRHIVSEGIRYLLSYQEPTDFANNLFPAFPFSIHAETERKGQKAWVMNRLGWCYGDLNEVLTLYRAAALFNQPAWKQVADEVGIKTLQRKILQNTAVADAHFCHGAAGLAQFYQLLAELSGNPVYLEGHHYWLTETIRLLPADLEKDAENEQIGGFLEGTVGTGLVLLAALSEDAKDWSKMMLL